MDTLAITINTMDIPFNHVYSLPCSYNANTNVEKLNSVFNVNFLVKQIHRIIETIHFKKGVYIVCMVLLQIFTHHMRELRTMNKS